MLNMRADILELFLQTKDQIMSLQLRKQFESLEEIDFDVHVG